jgi:hypothetical protein
MASACHKHKNQVGVCFLSLLYQHVRFDVQLSYWPLAQFKLFHHLGTQVSMPLVRPPTQQSAASSYGTGAQPQQATIKPCPRPNPTQGLNDWLVVTSPKPIPNLDICPGCYNTSFRNTRYDSCISPALKRSANYTVQCDFSQLWIRFAYAVLYVQGQPNLNLLGEMAAIQRDADDICPNFNLEDPEVKKGGKPSMKRTWYCLRDPKTGGMVEELTACSDCVIHINTIFPSLNHIFVPVADGQKLLATCDLMTLGDGQQRYLAYVDNIAEVAQHTLETRERDLTPLIEYARKWAPIPVCGQGKVVTGQKEYSLPTTVPEFTACEECYTKHIAPLYTTNPQSPILSQIKAREAHPQGFMCDLFSPRLQSYWTDAVNTNDIQTFRQKLQARNAKMQEVDQQLGRMKQQYQQLTLQKNMHMNQMKIAQMQATSRNTQWMASGWIAPPLDFSAANTQMAKASEAEMQAAIIMDNMTALERQFLDYWR